MSCCGGSVSESQVVYTGTLATLIVVLSTLFPMDDYSQRCYSFRISYRMTPAERVDVEESKSSLTLEELEAWNLA